MIWYEMKERKNSHVQIKTITKILKWETSKQMKNEFREKGVTEQTEK